MGIDTATNALGMHMVRYYRQANDGAPFVMAL